MSHTGRSEATHRRSRLPLRTRIGLLVAIAVCAAVALTSVAAYITTRREMRESVDDNLVERAQAAVDNHLPVLLADLPSEALGAADLRAGLLYPNELMRTPKGPLGAPPVGAPELAVARGESVRSLRTVESHGVEYRVVSVPSGIGPALVLAQPTRSTEEVLSELRIVLLVVGGIGVLIAAFAGVAIARAGLRPIDRLSAAAEHVARTDELNPVEVEGDDELGRLARSFNSMLAALEQSRLRQQQLVADAGHELRTPLTSLRTNLDLLIQSTREGSTELDREERDALLADVRAQIEEMSELVGDLMVLARGDASPSHPGAVELTDVVERALDRVRRRAPTVTFATNLQPWQVFGDEADLERAVTNLLDNAAKWSPPGGTVTVRLSGGQLEVGDEGSGFTEQDLPHVFERFYRAAEARGRPGSGLGLAIVRQVIERHGGTASAGNAPSGGALLSVWLPGVHPPDNT